MVSRIVSKEQLKEKRTFCFLYGFGSHSSLCAGFNLCREFPIPHRLKSNSFNFLRFHTLTLSINHVMI